MDILKSISALNRLQIAHQTVATPLGLGNPRWRRENWKYVPGRPYLSVIGTENAAICIYIYKDGHRESLRAHVVHTWLQTASNDIDLEFCRLATVSRSKFAVTNRREIKAGLS